MGHSVTEIPRAVRRRLKPLGVAATNRGIDAHVALGVVPSVVELAGGGLLGNGFYAAIPGCLKRAEGSSKASISRGMSRKPRTRRKRCSASSRAALTQRWIISPPRQRLTFRV